MPPPTAEVSGRALLGMIRHAKDTRGADALKEMIAESGDAARAVFSKPIRMMEYYPYEAYIGFLRTIDRRLGTGDQSYARTVGEIAGKLDLGTIFRVYTALASAERLIRACEKVWPSYYRNSGTMTAITWDPSDTRLRIEGFSQMHPLHCRLMEGWMTATMETIGFRVENGRESACCARGASYHEFACTWERARTVGGTFGAIFGR